MTYERKTTDDCLNDFLSPVAGADVRRLAEDLRSCEQALAAAERERDEWKRCYELRGRALERPCISCGYQPKVIRVMDAARAEEQR